MSNSPVLMTDRLHIRILGLADKESLFRYHALPEVCRYQGWKPKMMADVESFIVENTAHPPNTSNTWMQLAVCLKDGPLIGDIGIHFLEDELQAEIGYTLSPDFQGKGYAGEAVKANLEYLFFTLKKHRVTASVDPDNLRSIRLLEKLGFRKEAHFVKSYRMNDQWTDDCVYAMLAEEWQGRPLFN